MLKYAEGQLKVRSDAVTLTPLRSMDDVPEQEFKKGEIAGISLFVKLPQIVIDDLTSQLTATQGESDVSE